MTIGYKGNVSKQNNINSKIVSNDVRHQEQGLGTSSDSQVQRPFGVSIIDWNFDKLDFKTISI